MEGRNVGFERNVSLNTQRSSFCPEGIGFCQEKNPEKNLGYDHTENRERRVEFVENLDSELSQKQRWTEEEDNILKEFFPTEGKDVADRLYGRTIAACQFRAYKLGLHRQQPHSRGKWLKGEDMLLRRWYPEMGIRVAILLPWRSKPAIHNRANLLGLHISGCLQPPVDPEFYNCYKRKRLLHSQRVEKQRRKQ